MSTYLNDMGVADVMTTYQRVWFDGYRTTAPWLISIYSQYLSTSGRLGYCIQCRAVIDDFGSLVPVTPFA